MYENYTSQSLPEKKYRELLGTAICVFNSNNGFIIENILNYDGNKKYSWFDLIDGTSGDLLEPIKETITKVSGKREIAQLFGQLISKRNRIIHSFRITDEQNRQVLATKDKNHTQFHITEEYMINFIQENSKLSNFLHQFRGY